jgi:hypothetical protein
MITTILNKRYLPFYLTLAILFVGVQQANAQQFIARLTTTGVVTVNGTSAASGASLLTGATIETPAATSSAVVSIGKLGRVEVMPATKIELRFEANSIAIALFSGGVKVSTDRGVTATIDRK